VRTLRKFPSFDDTDALVQAARKLEAVRIEPPERGGKDGPLKWHCADEAFFLVEMFSAKAPSGYIDGPFRKIAVQLYEAVTGRSGLIDDLGRTCERLLEERRKVRHRPEHRWGW
jgi:hypothetical protein